MIPHPLSNILNIYDTSNSDFSKNGEILIKETVLPSKKSNYVVDLDLIYQILHPEPVEEGAKTFWIQYKIIPRQVLPSTSSG